jgi:hypothetical protein
MRVAKYFLIVGCFVAVLYPTLAGASSTYPAPTSKAITAAIQGKVNAKYPQDKKSGETTLCTYIQKKAKMDYKFKCLTFNQNDQEVASTTVQLLQPEGKLVTYVYVVTPSPGSLPKVTFIVTATGGNTGSVTYGAGSANIQKNDVKFPFTATLPGGSFPVMVATLNSGAKDASITCEIKQAGQATIKNTSTGPYTVAQCG